MAFDVAVGLKNAAFRSGLEQMRGQARRFSLDLKGMVGGIAGGFAAAFSVGGLVAFADRMREIKREAARFGTSAEEVQRMGKAAKSADVDFETLAKGLNHVTLEAGRAARGSSAQAQIFKTLGIDAARFATLPMPERLRVLAGAFEASRGSGEKTAAMLELLGNRGQEMIPLLAQGGAAIAQTMSEAQVQTNATVEAMARLSRQVDKMKGTGSRWLGNAIGGTEKWLGRYAYFMQRNADTGDYKQAWKEAMHYKPERDDEKPRGEKTNDFNVEGVMLEKKKGLLKQIAEAVEANQAKELDGTRKINALIAERDRYAAKGKNGPTASEEEVQNYKKAVELYGEIAAAKKDHARAVAGAQRNRAQGLESDYLRLATPKEKAAYLREKQGTLRQEAKDYRARGLDDKAIEKGTEADRINEQLQQIGGQAPRISVGSLQRIGGGGGGFQGDLVARQNDRKVALLEQIRDALKEEAKAIGGSTQTRDY